MNSNLKSVDEEVFSTIRKNVEFTEEEFMNMPDPERKEWIDAWRLAKLLDSERHDEMVKGYKNTEVYSENETYNLSVATVMIHGKKRALNIVEKYTDIDLTPAQFILMGDLGTKDFLNDAMKEINKQTIINSADYKN